jgi:hypothetical protein
MFTKTATRRAAVLAFTILAAVCAPYAANAAGASVQVAQPRVLVPHVPTPTPQNRISGCWSSQRLIYGPYAFSFCTNGEYGSYQVRGGGLSCDGSVNVSPGPGNSLTVNLSRSQCNGWTDWSADRLVCRPSYSPNAVAAPTPRVATPSVPTPHVPAPVHRLDCTYFPSVSGYHPIGLALSRN